MMQITQGQTENQSMRGGVLLMPNQQNMSNTHTYLLYSSLSAACFSLIVKFDLTAWFVLSWSIDKEWHLDYRGHISMLQFTEKTLSLLSSSAGMGPAMFKRARVSIYQVAVQRIHTERVEVMARLLHGLLKKISRCVQLWEKTTFLDTVKKYVMNL